MQWPALGQATRQYWVSHNWSALASTPANLNLRWRLRTQLILWNCILVTTWKFIRGIVQRGVSSACAIWKKIHCYPLINFIGFFNMPSTQTSLATYYVKMGDMSTTSDQRIDAAKQKLIGWANLSNILSMICTSDFYISNTECDQQLEDLHCWVKSFWKANVVYD